MMLARVAAEKTKLAIRQMAAIGDDESQDVAIEPDHSLEVAHEEADMTEAQRYRGRRCAGHDAPERLSCNGAKTQRSAAAVSARASRCATLPAQYMKPCVQPA